MSQKLEEDFMHTKEGFWPGFPVRKLVHLVRITYVPMSQKVCTYP